MDIRNISEDKHNNNRIPLISIVMPAYNAERYIRQAIDSVLAQTWQNWELVVIDDCSKDHTADIIDAYAGKDSRVKHLKNSVNSGASATRHHGVSMAAGEWVAFLDSDDAWLPEKLEKQMDLCSSKGADFCFTGSSFMDEQGRPLEYELHAPSSVRYTQLLKQNVISNSSVLIRKELFTSHEIVAEGIHEDFACWLNVLREGATAYGIDEPLLTYRISASSKSGNKAHAAIMNWKTYRKVGLNALQAGYYMCWYTVKGLLKYRHLK